MKSPIIDEYKCGCTIAGDKLGIITWDKCAIHSKAPAMYEALKGFRDSFHYLLESEITDDGPLRKYILKLDRIATSALEGL